MLVTKEPATRRPYTTTAIVRERTRIITLGHSLVAVWVAVSFLWIHICLSQTKKVDSLLENGPFSTSTDILAAPETIYLGETISEQEIVQSLWEAGYAQTANNPAGWFEEHGSALHIFPGEEAAGDDSPVRIEFQKGAISAITGLQDRKPRTEYALDPALLTNLSSGREKRRLVHYSAIPPSLVHAVVSVEDKHFFQHGGLDLQRIAKAAYVDLKDGRKREGGSTLTMQLARGFWLDRNKSYSRKAQEILLTLYLEHKLTKQEIFEDYANQVYLGQYHTYSINGFGQAARTYFGKNLSEINASEAALLAGMVRGPSYYDLYRFPARARERRNLVLSLMRANGYLSETDYQAFAAVPLKMNETDGEHSADPYFLAVLNGELRSKNEGGHNRRVYTTLEPRLERAAEAAVKTGMADLDRQIRERQGQPPQVALVALDPHTGEIKALVGGRDYLASQLNHALAMRQPGSAFKPFVYAAALDTGVHGGRKVFTPATIVTDVATTFPAIGGLYQPKDFEPDYMGDVTLRKALAMSLNIPAVSVAQQVGYQSVVDIARKAGLNESIQATPSVALGAYETTPLELAGGYTIFANLGQVVRPTAISSVRARNGMVLSARGSEQRAVLDPRVAYLMVNMMEEVLRSGTAAGARSHGFWLPAAGKTGTSRDGWFAGFTDKLLCVVWVGFDDNHDLNMEGAKSALPIWTEFMRRAAQIRPYSQAQEFQRPRGIITVEVCSDSGKLPGPNCPNVRGEVFVAGTQPATECDGLHDNGLRADGGNRP